MSNAVLELTMDELETVSGGDLGDLSQMESIRLQMVMDRWSKTAASLSNILKKMSDTSSQIVGNLK